MVDDERRYAVLFFAVLMLVGCTLFVESCVPIANADPDEIMVLAANLDIEGRSQPPDAKTLMALAILHTAQRRGITIYQLSRTEYLAGWDYSQKHPDSWQAQAWDNPSAGSLVVARDVYNGVVNPADWPDAGHFTGVETVWYQNQAIQACPYYQRWDVYGQLLFLEQLGTTCFYQ